MSETFHMKYALESKEVVFDGFFQVNRMTFSYSTFDNQKLEGVVREVFMRGPAVGVLLVDLEKEKVVLVEQFRAGAAAGGSASPWLIELVAGIVEPGEEPIDVAARESLEEAGCEPLKLVSIQKYWVSPGGSDETFHIFCGLVKSDEVSQFGGLEEEHEDIRVHVIDFDTVFLWLDSGELNNAMALVGIQWLKLNLARLPELMSE